MSEYINKNLVFLDNFDEGHTSHLKIILAPKYRNVRIFVLAVIGSYVLCTATGVVLLINSCEYCTVEAESISGNVLKIIIPSFGHGSAVNTAKHEFLQQIFNQQIILSAKGFFVVNRRFLATVRLRTVQMTIHDGKRFFSAWINSFWPCDDLLLR